MPLSSTLAESILAENRAIAAASSAQTDHDYATVCSDRFPESPRLPQVEDSDDGSMSSESHRISEECAVPGPAPWFRSFKESVYVGTVPGIQRIGKAIAQSRKFPDSISLVRALGGRRNQLFEQQVASRKRALAAEFPFGIAGARASLNKSPEAVKLCLFGHSQTTEAMGHSRPENISESLEVLGERTRGRPRREQPQKLSRQVSTAPVDKQLDKQATVPDVDLSLYRLRPSFKDTSRLVENPMVDELETAATWTFDEAVTFIRTYAANPKDFKRIAASLTDKSVADCIDFYYRYKLGLGLKLLSPSAGSKEGRRRIEGGSVRQLNQKVFLDNAIATLYQHVVYADVIPRDTSRKLVPVQVPRRDPRWPGEDEEERKLMISCLVGNDISREYLLAALFMNSYAQVEPSAPMELVEPHVSETTGPVLVISATPTEAEVIALGVPPTE